MKKKKIIIISLCSMIGLIFLDFIIALSFNNSPIIKFRDYFDGGSTVYIDKGLFTNTYKCSDGKTKTVLKTTKYICLMKDSKEEDKKETITITFDTKGGSKIDSITINKDTELTLPQDPTRDGYVFKGWVDKNETPIYNKVLLAEDTTLYAVWEKDETSNAITITFDTKGGSKINSITMNKDTELILPKEPTRDGYVFKGWVDKNETPIYNKVLLAEDTTLYAVWEKVENKKTSTKTEKPKTNTDTNTKNSSTNTNKPNQNTNNNTNTNNNENNILPDEKPPIVEKTKAEKNNEYRKILENKYSVKIIYKDENGDYLIGGSIKAEKLNDDNEIDKYLKEVESTLKKYPSGFFKEMKDNNVSLKIYMVNKIDGNYSGMTDGRNQSNITVTIGTNGTSLFENTLHHELMHYIDIYMRQKNSTLNLEEIMKSYNPEGFTYGDKSNEYVYYFTSVDKAYFLSAYGKTNYLEDRAVLFSDMMTRTTKRPYYNDGTPLNKKAKLISSQIKEYFKTLSNTERYHWDRFL